MELIKEYKSILIYKMNTTNKFQIALDTPDGLISNSELYDSIDEAIKQIDVMLK